MNITLKNTPDQLALAKAMGSKKQDVSRPAQETFAAAIPDVIAQVLKQVGTNSLIYTDHTFSETDTRTIPLDLFYNQNAGYVQTWYAPSVVGHLPTQELASFGEMPFTTYELESAVSLPKKYARSQSALNILARATDRMLQEMLLKQELQSWMVIMKAAGEARSTVLGTNQDQILQAGTAGTFKLDDLSRMITLSKRQNQSFAGGTPVAPYSKGVTDIFCSPEIKEDIRAFTYNPMNTTATPNTDESTALGLPDSIREEIFRSAGTNTLYGIYFTDLLELGVNGMYNQLFSTWAPANVAPGGGNFSSSANEILVGLDLTKQEFLRPVMVDNDIGGTIQVSVDDQWAARADKMGWYCNLQEGRIAVSSRSFVGLVV